MQPSLMCDVYFFFQAEDGIRDVAVTGVQTCALPIWSWSVIVFLILWSASLALAEEPSAPQRIATKFIRGAANFTTGWMELPKQVYLVGQREGWVTGALRGPIDGLGMFVARTIAGAYEVLTFPIPLPPRYQPILFHECIWPPAFPTIPADTAL